MNAKRAFAGPGLAWLKLVPSYGRWRFMDTHSILQRLLLAGLLTLAACSDSTAPPRGATQGAVHVTATTTGTDLPSGGYSVSVDSGAGQAVGANGAVTISGLSANRHSVTLYGVAANCTLSGVNTRSVDVTAGDTVLVAFDVGCTAIGASGEIAFTTNRDGKADVYVMNADGSTPTRLTNFPTYSFHPSWSPDGRKIAFASDGDGNYGVHIYWMGADGSNPTRLSNGPGDEYDPAWSPDGKKIAFTSDRDYGTAQIFVMNADGSNPVRLTDNLGLADDNGAAWTPDGRIIYAERICDEFYGCEVHINVMNADGTGKSWGVPIPGVLEFPGWSPDGAQIAFIHDGHVWVASADGSGQRSLEAEAPFGGPPVWSPDGTSIVFMGKGACLDACSPGIYRVNSDGSGLVRLTDNGYSPAWKP